MQTKSINLVDTSFLSLELSNGQFRHISQVVYDRCGINLGAGKEGLVKSRLLKRLRLLGLDSFDQYLEYVERDKSTRELSAMIDVLTTNKTSFFRESQHFDYMRAYLLPEFRSSGRRLRFWSAGCSSGEEPYSLAIILREEIPEIDRLDCRILATDISERVLTQAREARYEEDALRDIPPALLQKHFARIKTKSTGAYRVNDKVRGMVRLARLNLMDAWPMKGPFDVIFCRNVMIYFDKPTQKTLVRRFWDLLAPGGHLFVGHSESLTTCSQEFRYVQPAVYVK